MPEEPSNNGQSIQDFDLGRIREAMGSQPESSLGLHVLVDFHLCTSLPDEIKPLQLWMEEAATRMGCTLVNRLFHRFSPYGVSGVVIVAESHLAIHTWPEFKTACVDFFTCSDAMKPELGIQYLAENLGAGSASIKNLSRGKRIEFE